MHYHIILTKQCNLNCDYCGGGSDSDPKEIQYSISDLGKFLSHDKTPVIGFYGGEPLLRIETMKRIMDTVPGRYVIQTNGLLLDKVESGYLEKFHSILVSIDGKKEVTDSKRGSGVYGKVVGNAKLIRERGFSGDLIARMTVPQGTDIFDNVMHLAGLGIFDHIHWQLGFEMFWESGEEETGLETWVRSYNSGISSLVSLWIGEMERTGKVPGFVPFIGVMGSLLLDEQPSHLRCGSGIDFFTVLPDGRISACPVSIDFDFSIIGSIYRDSPHSLFNVRVSEPCISCGIFHICGGRCLFVNRAQDMLRRGGYSLICTTVWHLVRKLEGVLSRVEGLIEMGVLERREFEYPGFNNGCEIIP